MLTTTQLARLESMTRVGRTVRFRSKTTKKPRTIGTVDDEVSLISGDYKHLIQRVRLADGIADDGSTFGYRTGYYTFDAHGEHIKWGQFTQFLTEVQYRRLLGQAIARGWDIGCQGAA